MNPVVKNVATGVGGAIAATLIFLGYGNVTANNYQSPILSHLVDIVRGPNTTTAVALNVPAWSFGIPIPAPIVTSIATTSVGSIASSTTLYFAVAALDGTGTTTPSMPNSSITTDASTTLLNGEGVHLTFTNENGATGYAVFFGTSPTALTSYELATTSGQIDIASTTTSVVLGGSDTQTLTSAFEELLNPGAPDVFNDGIANATSSIGASTTAVQVGGTLDASASATSSACESDTAGAIFYNSGNGHEWGCNGTSWKLIF